MSKSYTVADTAAKLGMTQNGVRYRMKTGQLKGRKTAKGWRVYLNGNEPVPAWQAGNKEEENDPLIEIADELISLGRRLKKAVKEHDAEVRRETITDFARNLAETIEKGR